MISATIRINIQVTDINHRAAKLCLIVIKQQMIDPMCATIGPIILNPE